MTTTTTHAVPAPHRFRHWRRTRPFWGGLLTALGGLELISIPLAPMPLVVHQGMAGVASWLIGALLIVAGVLMWVQPAQRSFYGILAVLLSLASFLTSNFGGFLAGMLLGLLGGALGFAWSPAARRTRPEPAATPYGDVPPPAPTPYGDATPYGAPHGGGTTGSGRGSGGGKMLAIALPAALPAVLGVHALAPAPADGTRMFSDATTLRADSLTMSGLSYDGVAELPTARGTVRALKFTMSKAVLKGVDQTTARGGAATRLATGNLTLDGGVVMLTTKMSSKLLGVPLTFTPDRPPPLTLPTMVMTDVVSEQPSVRAGGARISGLDVSRR